ncbi:MAG: phosphatase PAP2 family protein [Sphingomonadales bacterium]
MTAAAIILSGGYSTALAGDTVEDAGSATRIALPVVASAVALVNGDTEGFWQHAFSITVTTGITLGLKEAIDSERPNLRNNNSFPSGHTSQAFASASFLDHRYGWQYGLPAYVAATYVAFSRVNSDEHRIRDVAAGALLAWGVSHFFVDPHQRVSVEGEVTPNRALLRLRMKW